MLFVIVVAAGDKPHIRQQSAQTKQYGAGQAGCNRIDCFCGGYLPAPHVKETLFDTVEHTNRGILHRSGNDIRRCSLERKYAFHQQAGGFYRLVFAASQIAQLCHKIGEVVEIVVGCFQCFLKGIYPRFVQNAVRDLPRLKHFGCDTIGFQIPAKRRGVGCFLEDHVLCGKCVAVHLRHLAERPPNGLIAAERRPQLLNFGKRIPAFEIGGADQIFSGIIVFQASGVQRPVRFAVHEQFSLCSCNAVRADCIDASLHPVGNPILD